MSHQSDQAYFALRCDEENRRGDAAITPRVASIHYELAYRYALLCGNETPDSSVIYIKQRAFG